MIALVAGLSPASVQWISARPGTEPHLVRTFKLGKVPAELEPYPCHRPPPTRKLVGHRQRPVHLRLLAHHRDPSRAN